MAVIRPPITGDAVLDSWTNQITQALNSGIIGAVGATGQATTGASGFNTATIYLFARTTTNSAPAKPNETTVYTYDTGVLLGSSSNNNGETSSGLGTGSEANTWFRSVPASSNGDYAWITTVNIADLDPVETILSSSWTTVSALAAPGLSNRVDIAYFTVLDGSSGTNSFPTGTVAGGNYTKATKGSRNFEGIRTVSWEGIETAPSTTIGDYVITQMQGDEGTKVSVVELFKVSASNSSAPADPTGTFTYTFATNILSGGTPDGWLQNASTVPAGQYLWKIQASATSTASSVQIASSAFSNAIVVSGTGAVGDTGQRQTTGLVYYTAQSENPPPLPTNGTSGGTSNATWDWSTGKFATSGGLPSNWSMSAPTPNPTDTYSYWQSAFSAYETTNGGTTTLSFATATRVIVFDGIVRFTNSNLITDGSTTTTLPKTFTQPGVPTSVSIGDLWFDTDDDQTYIAESANASAVTAGGWVRAVDGTAQAAAVAAQGELDDMGLDSKVTPVEKIQAKIRFDSIMGEYDGIIASAIDAGITSSITERAAYVAANTALDTYLTTTATGTIDGANTRMFNFDGTLWLPTSTHTVVAATWQSKFNTYYDTRQALLDLIAAKLKDLGDSKANVFYQDAAPTALATGDIWHKTDSIVNGLPKVYIAKSVGANAIVTIPSSTTGWLNYDFAQLINGGETTINGNRISTGEITAAHIEVGGIRAENLTIDGNIAFSDGGAYKYGMNTPMDGTAGIFVGNPEGSSEYTIAYQGDATESNVKSLLVNENLFELKNPTIQTGTTSTTTVTRQTGSTTNIVVPTEAISLTIIAIGGGGGGGGGQSDISSTSVSGVVGVTGGTTTASVDNSLGNVSAAGGVGGLSGSNISAGSGVGVSGAYGTGGAQGSAGNTGGAGGNASGYGAGGGGSGSRNYGGWLNSGQDAVSNGGGGQAGSVDVSGPHDVSSLGAITISSISIGAGNVGGNGNAAGAGGTGTAGRIIVSYTTTSLTDVHLLTTAEKTTIDNGIVTKYISSNTSYSNSDTLTFAHSLGAVPHFVVIDGICTTADQSFSVGDRIQVSENSEHSGSNEGMGIKTDATNVTVYIGQNGIGIVTTSDGDADIVTTGKWSIQVKAFLVG